MAHRLGQYVQLCIPIGRLGSVAGSAGALSVLSCRRSASRPLGPHRRRAWRPTGSRVRQWRQRYVRAGGFANRVDYLRSAGAR